MAPTKTVCVPRLALQAAKPAAKLCNRLIDKSEIYF